MISSIVPPSSRLRGLGIELETLPPLVLALHEPRLTIRHVDASCKDRQNGFPCAEPRSWLGNVGDRGNRESIVADRWQTGDFADLNRS